MEMKRTAEELREIELSFAYEMASGLIDIETFEVWSEERDEVSDWHDLASADVDLSEAVDYLVSRNLIEFHPDNRNWVRILDEDEPIRSNAPGQFEEKLRSIAPANLYEENYYSGGADRITMRPIRLAADAFTDALKGSMPSTRKHLNAMLWMFGETLCGEMERRLNTQQRLIEDLHAAMPIKSTQISQEKKG
jgi:hypothetical protein